MRKLAALGVMAVALGTPAAAQGAAPAKRTYLVLYEKGASLKQARAAIRRSGGRIVRENKAIGLATVVAPRSARIQGGAIAGVARNRRIGKAPKPKGGVERERGDEKKPKTPPPPPDAEPLAGFQWDMALIHATPEGSYRTERGSHDVRVGVIDTGIDGSHPDIAPNFDRGLSRNFTKDDPLIDGPCADEPDKSCNDPADVDEDGHGTHVAGTIGSPLNGAGIGGVAPGVDLVNLRAGQDSGYFFLQPTVDALTYAGDHGVDVVNMSFYIDPWLYNCAANPADSEAQQQEQRTIIAATQRAIDYARARGVTPVAALGNENTDLGHPTSDDTSPDYPPDSAHPRTIDNSCVDMPTEANGVIAVSALGRTAEKAYYSNWGTEQTDVSAPGGDRRLWGTEWYGKPESRILAPMPAALVTDESDPLIVKSGGAYYQWLQGTSMAAPHAVGVAALIVARWGHPDQRNGGLTLKPSEVEKLLTRTATDHACPADNPFHYGDPALDPESYTATCEGDAAFNGFYGHGIVDALAAVSGRT